MDTISLISLIISFLSVIAAIIALYLAFKQSKESKEQLTSVKKIIESLSTKFIGEFPLYNSKISDLIERAKKSVDLLYDVPVYGIVSDPNSAIDIVKGIKSKIRKDNNIEVSISVYSPEMREKVIMEQQKNLEFDTWKYSQGIKPKMMQFLRNYTENLKLTDLTKEDYIKASTQEHEETMKTSFKGAKINYINELLPLYFWMIDESEAIISIPSYAGGVSEYGFYTSDSDLIKALITIKTRYNK